MMVSMATGEAVSAAEEKQQGKELPSLVDLAATPRDLSASLAQLQDAVKVLEKSTPRKDAPSTPSDKGSESYSEGALYEQDENEN